MAVDPPYRLDPLQNPVNVKWGGGEDDDAPNEVLVGVTGEAGGLFVIFLTLHGHGVGSSAPSGGGGLRWVTFLDDVTVSGASPLGDGPPYGLSAEGSGLTITARLTDQNGNIVLGPIVQDYSGQQVRDALFSGSPIFTAISLTQVTTDTGGTAFGFISAGLRCRE